MAPEGERRGGPESGKGDFAGRDLLVGRPEGAAVDKPSAGAAPAAISPQPGAHDDAIREILETLQATAARIDALQDAPGPAHETAEALARETAALTQAVEDARGALAKAAELAARRDGQASAGARVLAERRRAAERFVGHALSAAGASIREWEERAREASGQGAHVNGDGEAGVPRRPRNRHPVGDEEAVVARDKKQFRPPFTGASVFRFGHRGPRRRPLTASNA